MVGKMTGFLKFIAGTDIQVEEVKKLKLPTPEERENVLKAWGKRDKLEVDKQVKALRLSGAALENCNCYFCRAARGEFANDIDGRNLRRYISLERENTWEWLPFASGELNEEEGRLIAKGDQGYEEWYNDKLRPVERRLNEQQGQGQGRAREIQEGPQGPVTAAWSSLARG